MDSAGVREGRKGWGFRVRKDLIFQVEEGQLSAVAAGCGKECVVRSFVCFV